MLIHFRELSSWQDQYEVFKVVQGYFVPSRQSLKLAEEVARRAECLAAVRQVAAHLGLPKNEAPSVMQYEATRKELGLGLSVWTIERRWYSWYEVRKALRGEAVRKTPRERSRFEAAIRYRPILTIAGLRLDTSHDGTDVGPNRLEDGPRWRILDHIPTWAHWSIRHPPGL